MNDTVTTEAHAMAVATGGRARKGRRRALVALPVAAVLLLAGCGDDNDDEGKSSPSPTVAMTTPAAPPSSAAPVAPAPANTATFTADQQGAAKAYTTVFNPATPTAQRVALVQDAAKLQDMINTMIQSPLLGQVSVAIKDVQVNGDTANVTFDILVNGQPGTLPTQTMPAVKQDGVWKVGGKTICTLAPFAGATVSPQCANYS